MFTEEQLDVAYKNLKGGEKFPNYVKALNSMGVDNFIFYLKDGASVYHAEGKYHSEGKPKYKELKINQVFTEKQVKHAIKEYNEGNTDYVTFCHQLTDAGVYKYDCNTENNDIVFSDKEGTHNYSTKVEDL